MKLYYDKKSKDPTYFIQQGYRNGKKVSSRNVARIGKHSELLKITDDPLTYAKEQVKKANEEAKSGKTELTIKIDFSQKLKATKNVVSKTTSLNIGYFVLQKIYHDLKISEFLKAAQADRKITFDCNTINRFLTYARILDPDSKAGTYDKLDTYYEQPDFDYQHILRFMDVLTENYDAYLRHLFENTSNIVKLDTSVCYYDTTNFYFETEIQDPDYIDAVTGELIRGFRRFGISKDHKPNPLVQMGMFIDGNGIPITMHIWDGSSSEQLTAVPTERKVINMLKNKKIIYCADAGLGNFDIRTYNDISGRAFVVTQSVKKLSAELQKQVFTDTGWQLLSNRTPATVKQMKEFDRFDPKNLDLYNDRVFKVIEADKAIDLGLYETKKCANGKTKKVKAKGLLKQHVIVTFSRKSMEYQRAVRNRQIERAQNLLKMSKSVEDIKQSANDVKRFIKRTSKSEDGKIATIDDYQLDYDKIAEEEKYDGYYAIATNLEDDVAVPLEISARRYMIESNFRTLKTNLSAHPIFHRLEPRIVAHFMICYTALLILSILQKKLDDKGTHFTVDQIQDTLKNMAVTNLEDMAYASAYTSSEVNTAFNALFNLELDKKFYSPKALNRTIKKIL